jgi:hypothetical protein
MGVRMFPEFASRKITVGGIRDNILVNKIKSMLSDKNN